ncbi:MAG: permease [Zetaproteobacteria bacterium CG06_land_8_20_14_3_00_59_53]|nr:MAG: permease [Zetaproteobacteria bacterium CG2_30_59_37]PIO90677.1 MAG: permease [Zetaproteobacteria bacterium CG23_combo_of_CG06-09_8_20_14_all_59_86]PIQ66060.1 MAG: permease [Zetaproteobacteria bacterium CG11_big_fil_rev_8_21_14_0_20_59_439]PIU70000.1 MAG: permease [Zetaproteobacteria bacterium CG06_land_8_20_14_3_00_59_53]PIU97884.1 MAG: permease [Zetaproteobacteria bacterium CG03_land_8_20_14_0_80_59_51]PIY45843.1 MAG: permease [Zetaproteobacteria bacterium CG_4_10_14_0_8_um_filter_59_
MAEAQAFRWWHRGDLDGFFGLFVDNLIQLILIVQLCTFVLGMPADLVYGRILPGVAVSLLLGNLFYAWQARRLHERTGRPATALPYGVNTISLFAFVLFVMLPVVKTTGDAALAWQMGLAACLGSGLIELGGAWIAARVKRITPRAALLATLAGIALTFISMDFAFRIFADPLIGFAPLALILMRYVGGMRLPFDMPAGLAAVLLGTLLAWGLGRMDGEALAAAASISLHPPVPAIGDMLGAFSSTQWLAFLSVILPMGLFNLVGSLQNLESAEAAGDEYPVKSSLAVNGIGTIAAACFGSCFPTTIYIGHPAWKRMGAGSGYSVANGIAVTLLCCLGLVGLVSALIPIEAGAAILLWIGMVIAAQAFEDTDRTHAPAVVIGLIPAMAAWGLMMLENGLRAAGQSIGSIGEQAFATILPISGMLSLERGFIFTSMLLGAMTACLIDRHYRAAAGWAGFAALCSATGIIHGYSITPQAIVNAYGPMAAWPFTVGYLVSALLFLFLGGYAGKRPVQSDD